MQSNSHSLHSSSHDGQPLDDQIKHASVLSPKRNTTQATTVEALVDEQLAHFGIDANSHYGKALAQTAHHLYGAQSSVMQLWEITSNTLQGLDQEDRVVERGGGEAAPPGEADADAVADDRTHRRTHRRPVPRAL